MSPSWPRRAPQLSSGESQAAVIGQHCELVQDLSDAPIDCDGLPEMSRVFIPVAIADEWVRCGWSADHTAVTATYFSTYTDRRTGPVVSTTMVLRGTQW